MTPSSTQQTSLSTGTGHQDNQREMGTVLVSVDSEDVQRRVENVTASASTPHAWLGLRHSCVVGLWFWVNGQTLCYERWAAGNGTGEEDCTTTVRSGAIQTRDQRWISLPEKCWDLKIESLSPTGYDIMMGGALTGRHREQPRDQPDHYR